MEPPSHIKRTRIIIPTTEVEVVITPYIESIRREGFSERTVLEWSLLAWDSLDQPPREFVFQPINPMEAIEQTLEEVLIENRLLEHLSLEERALVLRDFYRVCREGFVYFASCLQRLGFEDQECRDLMIHDWLEDSLILDVIHCDL